MNPELLFPLPASAIFNLALNDEAARGNINERNAYRLSAELAFVLRHYNQYEFTQLMSADKFKESYDPDLPTIAFDTESISGTSLFALAANSGDKKANILYVSSATQFGHFATREDGSADLLATEGVIVTREGRFMAGVFPTPIRINSLQTSDKILFNFCDAYDIPPMMSRQSNQDKSIEHMDEFKRLLPRRFSLEELWLENENAAYVIKPSNRYFGIGVNKFHSFSDAERAFDYFNFLKEHGYEPIIEEYVESMPLIDPATGEELEWFVKTLLDNGSVVGMYIQAFKKGDTINHAGESKVIGIDELPEYFEDSSQAIRIIGEIFQAAELISRKLPPGYRSADMVVDNDERCRLFEINAGNVGGLLSITDKEDANSKFGAVQTILDNWIKRIRSNSQVKAGNYVDRISIPNGLVASFVAAAILERTVRVSRITLDDIGGDEAQPEAIAKWLLLQHYVANRQENTSRQLEIEKLHRTRFPLDILLSLPQWIASSPDRYQYRPYLSKLAYLLPNYRPVQEAMQSLDFYTSDWTS
ncbi:MAG TPA: hypothetical protein VLG47_04390 [Candidatus Saccharimonadales bacterium]|nr:hypothetical protein [Candidatus Saccharimonadales bacterium]